MLGAAVARRSVFLGLIAAASRMPAQVIELRGIVVTTGLVPIAGAEVVVNGHPGGTHVRTMTDSIGAFHLQFDRQRDSAIQVTIRRVTFDGFVFNLSVAPAQAVVDIGTIRLSGGPAALQPLVVTVDKRRKAYPMPPAAQLPPVRDLDASHAGLFNADPSDLNGIISELPGVQSRGDSGFAVLGATASENRVLVDGDEFAGGSVPRDAIAQIGLAATPVDAAAGRFAGGQVGVSTRQGTKAFQGLARVQSVNPELTWSDPSRTVPPSSLVSVSGFAGGPLAAKATYLVAFDGSRQSSSPGSVFTADPLALAGLGANADSVTNARYAIMGLIPSASGPTLNTSNRLSTLARVDRDLGANGTLSISALASITRVDGRGLGALAAPTASLSSGSTVGRIMGTWDRYLAGGLNEFRLSGSPSHSFVDPTSPFPAGRLVLQQTATGSDADEIVLRFGGDGSSATDRRGMIVSASDGWSWIAPKYSHQIKVTVEGRIEEVHNSTRAGSGSVTYSSIPSLLANQPSVATRLDNSESDVVAGRSGAFSINDDWRIVPEVVTLQLGLRVDFAHYSLLQPIDSVSGLLGVSGQNRPSANGFSPRLGLHWQPGAKRNDRPPAGTVILARGGKMWRSVTAPVDVGGVAMDARATPITVDLSGGYYRGVVSVDQARALGGTNGSVDPQVESCVAAGIVPPAWTPGSTVQCAEQSSSTSSITPQRRFFGPGFQSPGTWRVAGSVAGMRLAGMSIDSRLTVAWGVHGQSWIDRNLQANPSFLLADEASRPVFAPAADVIPSTGLLGPGVGRITPGTGPVIEYQSDLSSTSGQLLLTVAPARLLEHHIPLYAEYSLSMARQQVRPSVGTTGGSLWDIETEPGDDPIHQFTIGVRDVAIGIATLAVRVRLFSGAAYTPVVATDINGDGLANDRAYIPGRAAPAGSMQAANLDTLLAAIPRAAASCIVAAEGTVAKPDSCRGPWQAQLDMALSLHVPFHGALGRRLNLSANVINAGSAVARVLGLGETWMGRLQNPSLIDQRAWFVTGFDPTHDEFIYRANPNFGQSLDVARNRTSFLPFKVQIGASVELGHIVPAAPTTPLKQRRVSMEQAEALVWRGLPRNSVTQILADSIRLDLTREQIDAVAGLAATLSDSMHAVVKPLVDSVVNGTVAATQSEIFLRLNRIFARLRELDAETRAGAMLFLRPDQRQRVKGSQ